MIMIYQHQTECMESAELTILHAYSLIVHAWSDCNVPGSYPRRLHNLASWQIKLNLRRLAAEESVVFVSTFLSSQPCVPVHFSLPLVLVFLSLSSKEIVADTDDPRVYGAPLPKKNGGAHFSAATESSIKVAEPLPTPQAISKSRRARIFIFFSIEWG